MCIFPASMQGLSRTSRTLNHFKLLIVLVKTFNCVCFQICCCLFHNIILICEDADDACYITSLQKDSPDVTVIWGKTTVITRTMSLIWGASTPSSSVRGSVAVVVALLRAVVKWGCLHLKVMDHQTGEVLKGKLPVTAEPWTFWLYPSSSFQTVFLHNHAHVQSVPRGPRATATFVV